MENSWLFQSDVLWASICCKTNFSNDLAFLLHSNRSIGLFCRHFDWEILRNCHLWTICALRVPTPRHQGDCVPGQYSHITGMEEEGISVVMTKISELGWIYLTIKTVLTWETGWNIFGFFLPHSCWSKDNGDPSAWKWKCWMHFHRHWKYWEYKIWTHTEMENYQRFCAKQTFSIAGKICISDLMQR